MENRICRICSSSYIEYGQKLRLCKPCRRAYDREYYHRKSAERKSAKVKLQRKRIVEIGNQVNKFKTQQGCAECGNTDFRVLEFDHLTRENKQFNISDAVKTGYSLERIFKEIDKCQVLCANCHRIKTWKETERGERE